MDKWPVNRLQQHRTVSRDKENCKQQKKNTNSISVDVLQQPLCAICVRVCVCVVCILAVAQYWVEILQAFF